MNTLHTSMIKNLVLLSLGAALYLSSCKKKDDEPTPVADPKYLLEVRSADANTVVGLHPVADLTSGQAEIKDASEVLFNFYFGDWNANGFVYSQDANPDKFVKYQTANGKVNAIQSATVPAGLFPSANVRLDDNRVWFVSKIEGTKVFWDVFNTTQMTFVKSGNFTLPLKSGYKLSAGFANKLGKDLVLGYHQSTVDTKVADSIYIAVLDTSSFNVKNTDSDGRSAAAGCQWSGSSFTAENGDVYFLTYPFANIGNNPTKPSAIMRILNGQSTIDDNYFFNVKEKVADNSLNGPSIYMGNNKLLVQIVREDLVKEGDYWGASATAAFQNEYYVLDLGTKAATKLDAPLSRGNSDGNPIKAGDNLYAFVVNAQSGNYIYTYNPATNETKQGLKYIGALVIYKIHNLK
ncbi:MAG TPA: DUF4374 domain-containing protein [Cytophagales bacterium]|nr:DUF4374 domain-containing protein [Cytophagales bacterium]